MWQSTEFKNLASAEPNSFIGGPFGSKLTSRDYTEEGVPVIRGGNLNSGRFLNSEDFVFVSEEKVSKDLTTNLAFPKDLIFTQRGTLGQVAVVPDEPFEKYVVSQSQMKVSLDDSKADRIFIYYFFSSSHTIKRILNLTASSGVPHINLTSLRSFEIPVPPLQTQKRIADILSAYDDLIENNRRRIELLEQAARLIYKEWFVHMRFPGHEKVRVVDGVPEGWDRTTLGDCADFLSGGTPKKSRPEFWGGSIPWVSSGELKSMRVHSTSLNITEEAVRSGSKVVPPGTILAVVRGMSLANEFRIGMTARPVTFNQDIKALVSKTDIDPFFLFHTLESRRDAIKDRAGEASHGTKKLETKVLSGLKVLKPDRDLQKQFREVALPMHQQWDALFRMNQKLEEARDLLLPRLMSGQIEV